ncbi:MAG: hypothetical protein U1E45_16430 [Geminicoccaceae bacterium]
MDDDRVATALREAINYINRMAHDPFTPLSDDLHRELLAKRGEIERMLYDPNGIRAEDIKGLVELLQKTRGFSSVSLTQDDLTGRHRAPNYAFAPSWGEPVLLLFLPKDLRQEVPGSLEEEYRNIADRHGSRYAWWWYTWQVAICVGDAVLNVVPRLIRAAVPSGKKE